jgi:hypothetical protein
MSNIYYNIPLDDFINNTEKSIELFMNEIYEDEKSKNSEYETDNFIFLLNELNDYVFGKNDDFINFMINIKKDKIDELQKYNYELNKKNGGGSNNFKYFYDKINYINKKMNNPEGKLYKIVKIGGNNESIEVLLKEFKNLYISALDKINNILKSERKQITNRTLEEIIDKINGIKLANKIKQDTIKFNKEQSEKIKKATTNFYNI